MSIFHAVVLGTIQGLTEFVPISSSGHLVLVPEALDWAPPGLAFDVLLHTASLVALVVYFAGELRDLVSGFFSGDSKMRKLALLLVIGTIPAAIAGIAFGDYFDDAFDDATASAVQLIITAAILVAGEWALMLHQRRTSLSATDLRGIDDLGPVDAGLIGAAQAVAILPGISRSGSTIATGLGLSVARDDSARFAFLLAVPALLGASIVELPELSNISLGTGSAIAGFVASLVTSYATIWALLRYLRTRTLYPFAVYCVVAGIFFLAVT